MPSDGLETDAIETLVSRQMEWEEQQLRDAIAETDWSETAVLRVVTTITTPTEMMFDGTFEMPEQTVEVERYSDTAPPLSEHAPTDATGHVEVRTITLSLLRRLADDHPEVAEVLAEATGGDAVGMLERDVEQNPDRHDVDGVNDDAVESMRRDVDANPELYDALAADEDDDAE